MADFFFVSEYLIMGAMLCFMTLTTAYFHFLVPRLAPNRSESTKALHKMLAIQVLYNGILYFLWLLPALIDGGTTDFYNEEDPRWANYHLVMDYLDMTLLPIGMLMGHVVTRGKLPSWKLFIGQIAPFAVAYCLDVALGWEWLRTVMGIYSIVYSLFQFIWYGRCVHIHQIFLINNFSNLEGRQMKWYLQAQIPVFLLCLLYYPLCVLPEASWPSLVYDLLTLGVMIFLVVMVMLNRMDDKAYELIEDLDMRKKKEEIFADAIQKVEKEAAVPVVDKAEPVAQEKKTEDASEEPKVWTRVEKESFDFGEQMKKLEEEEFFLDPDVNIDYLANKLGSNRHYVSNYLNQILKMPFYTYVNNLRLAYAEQLLRTSNDKASSIGYLSGFNSEATYRRLFKERYGCTPTQYIKRAA